jgi:hypothetical protein
MLPVPVHDVASAVFHLTNSKSQREAVARTTSFWQALKVYNNDDLITQLPPLRPNH